VHGQRQNLGGIPDTGGRGREGEMLECLDLRDRNGVVDTTGYTAGFQMALECIAITGFPTPNDEQMVDCATMGVHHGQANVSHHVEDGETAVILFGDPLTTGVVGVQMCEFHVQHRGLERVEAAVAPYDLVVILHATSEIGQ
jgi:hypothetical protein